jgi:1-acyl-sn-glycerol-3-phosphate acyltransferase
MIAALSRLILRILGWHTSAVLPEGVVKTVMIVAPHTSYWDFIVGRMTFWSSKLQIKVLIKKEAFVFPLGWFLRQLGGVPVARGHKNNLVEQATDLFQKNPTMVVVITPEGRILLYCYGSKGPDCTCFYRLRDENRRHRPALLPNR